jgi:hypothetical protein
MSEPEPEPEPVCLFCGNESELKGLCDECYQLLDENQRYITKGTLQKYIQSLVKWREQYIARRKRNHERYLKKTNNGEKTYCDACGKSVLTYYFDKHCETDRHKRLTLLKERSINEE